MKDDIASSSPAEDEPFRRTREHRRRRFRRHRRRAFIRSVYSLPSLATLGNALCGFAAMYVAALVPSRDPFSEWFGNPSHKFIWAVYFIFIAMVFDALDGRLARFARHTTDFGGQLDSLADVISFGVAPAFLAILVFKESARDSMHVPLVVSRLIWAIGGLFMSCGAIRLARFNVSNQHGEQHHFSFLGLPIPGAAGTVAAWVLMQRYFFHEGYSRLAGVTLWLLPLVVLGTALLMVSTLRYPHLVNRYLRGRKSFAQLLVILIVLLMLVVAHEVTIALGTFIYALWGPAAWTYARYRTRPQPPAVPPATPMTPR